MSFPPTPTTDPTAYPPPRYNGTSGEVSARFRAASTTPEFVSGSLADDGPQPATGTAYHYLATTASIQGEFGLYRVDMAAGARGPRAHFHKAISESFFVLDGALSLYDGQEWRDGAPGDFLYVPPGGLHAFDNRSEAPLSMLMLFAPGAPRERYFENIAHLAGMSQEQREQFLIEHDSYFVDG